MKPESRTRAEPDPASADALSDRAKSGKQPRALLRADRGDKRRRAGRRNAAGQQPAGLVQDKLNPRRRADLVGAEVAPTGHLTPHERDPAKTIRDGFSRDRAVGPEPDEVTRAGPRRPHSDAERPASALVVGDRHVHRRHELLQRSRGQDHARGRTLRSLELNRGGRHVHDPGISLSDVDKIRIEAVVDRVICRRFPNAGRNQGESEHQQSNHGKGPSQDPIETQGLCNT